MAGLGDPFSADNATALMRVWPSPISLLIKELEGLGQHLQRPFTDHAVSSAPQRLEDRMFRKLALGLFPALLVLAFAVATPADAKDPWKDAYKQQEKRAKEYQKYRRKQAKEEDKFCRKYGC